MKIKIGLDEAGRGCVLGSLYVGVVVFESSGDDKYFKSLGVKDSKQLSPENREFLFSNITRHCSYDHIAITPTQIDSFNLNVLEFNAMISLASSMINRYVDASIENVECEVYIDCPIKDAEQHTRDIENSLPHPCEIKVISENKADDKFVVVGASSIVAKVLRDREINEFKEQYIQEYGDIGSGYPSDWRTKKFLNDYYNKNRSFPSNTRMKWGTIANIRRDNIENSEFNWEEL